MLKVALVDCPRDPYCASPIERGGQPSLPLWTAVLHASLMMKRNTSIASMASH